MDERCKVYAGGWLENGKYYLDASVRIDNKDDALYIANAGNQDAIFDLKEFNKLEQKKVLKNSKKLDLMTLPKFNVRQENKDESYC